MLAVGWMAFPDQWALTNMIGANECFCGDLVRSQLETTHFGLRLWGCVT